MNKIINWIVGIIAVAALLLSIGNMVGSNSQPAELGNTGTRFPHGLSVGDGVGSGCYQIYATSSATVGKLTASSTSLVNGVSTGVMLFSYGSCLF